MALERLHCSYHTAAIHKMKPHRLLLPVSFVFTFSCVIMTSNVKNDFTVGSRRPGDGLIANTEEKVRRAPDYVFNFAKTYEGNNHVISQVVVEDLAVGGSGAYAAIVAGGPGHTFVTVAYTVPRYVQMMYNVSIYGKPPAFRKIP